MLTAPEPLANSVAVASLPLYGGLDGYWGTTQGIPDGHTLVSKFGEVPAVNTVDPPVDVWGGGGLYTGQPVAPTAETVTVASDNIADDAVSGQGAHTVEIQGLDANWDVQSDTVTLDGTVGVATTTVWKRVFRARVFETGTEEGNVGTVSVTGTDSSLLYVVMTPLQNQSQLACYTVPRNTSAIMTGLGFQMSRANGNPGSAAVTMRLRDGLIGGAFRSERTYQITNSLAAPLLAAPLQLPAYTDIRCRVDAVSDNLTIVSAQFDLVLVSTL